MPHNLTCATPADHAALADVMFDAVPFAPSRTCTIELRLYFTIAYYEII